MIAFPNCKINLGLNIIRKRNDGYHDLETVFYPLMIKDCVEVIRHPSGDNHSPLIDFSYTGLKIEGNLEENLCVKAYHLLKNDFPNLPAVQLHLHKAIPMGAGLGGGSADGAFTLQLLNDKFNLGISQEHLIEYALQVGSDSPFFIINEPCFATGRGEVMEKTGLSLSEYQLVIINPRIHISTAWAFSQITPNIPQKSIKEIIQQPIDSWKDVLVNDFESPVIYKHPAIGNIKQQLYNEGATYVSMTGSGSTVFGLFKKDIKPSLSFHSSYFVQVL